MKLTYRPYKCAACGNVQELQTNHIGNCYAHCPNCSWKCYGFAHNVSIGGPEGSAQRLHVSVESRLEYLRGEIEAERISYGEIAELQSLASYIDPSDTLLMQWAGIQESE